MPSSGTMAINCCPGEILLPTSTFFLADDPAHRRDDGRVLQIQLGLLEQRPLLLHLCLPPIATLRLASPSPAADRSSRRFHRWPPPGPRARAPARRIPPPPKYSAALRSPAPSAHPAWPAPLPPPPPPDRTAASKSRPCPPAACSAATILRRFGVIRFGHAHVGLRGRESRPRSRPTAVRAPLTAAFASARPDFAPASVLRVVTDVIGTSVRELASAATASARSALAFSTATS